MWFITSWACPPPHSFGGCLSGLFNPPDRSLSFFHRVFWRKSALAYKPSYSALFTSSVRVTGADCFFSIGKGNSQLDHREFGEIGNGDLWSCQVDISLKLKHWPLKQHIVYAWSTKHFQRPTGIIFPLRTWIIIRILTFMISLRQLGLAFAEKYLQIVFFSVLKKARQ